MATKSIPLKLMVHKSRNQVVFAESGKNFVDILLSFLTLPISTIIRLTRKHSSSIGCMENLYKSIEPLNAQGLLPAASKSILLRPSNAAAEICKRLNINVDDTPHESYYICDSDCRYKLLSLFPSTRCVCGKIMNREVCLMASSDVPSKDDDDGDVFVKGMSKYLISDDGVIAPVSTEGILSLLEQLEIKDQRSLEEVEVNVDHSTILLLLAHYFSSKTPFTDVFLVSRNDNQIPLKFRGQETRTTEGSALNSTNISIKLLVDKKEKRVLYAEAKQDFVDLLFSFLTFPAGSVVKKLHKLTGFCCIDNLYKSVECLRSLDVLKNAQIKEILLDPKLPQDFRLLNNLMKIEEEPLTGKRFYMCQRCDSDEVSIIPNVKCQCNAIANKKLVLADPKRETNGGFVMSAVYMVTDDLVVKHLSSVSVLCYHLSRSCRAEEGSVEVVAVDIREMEALALLQASLASSMVLTNAFASRLG